MGFALVAATWSALFCAGASSLPVQVRMRTQLSVELRSEGRNLSAGGRLVDGLGKPVSGAEVALDIPGVGTKRVSTGPDGTFEWHGDVLAAAPDATGLRVAARFAGDSRHGDARTEKVTDLSRADLELSIGARPSVVSRARATVTVGAEALSDGRPVAGVQVELKVGSKFVAQIETGIDGRAEVTLSPREVGPAGTYHLAARSRASERVNAAEATGLLTSVEPVEVSLATRRGEDDASVLEGAVFDLDGPVSAALVSVYTGTRVVAQTSTSSDGRWSVVLDRGTLADLSSATDEPSRTLDVVAVAEAPGASRERGISEVAHLRVPEPRRLPAWLQAAPLVFVALYTVTRAVRGWLRSRRSESERRRVAAGIPARTIRARGVPSTAPQDRIAGAVWDAERRRPATEAEVSVRGPLEEAPSAPLRLAVGPDGGFDSGPLVPGRWTLTVEAPLCERLDEDVVVPHDGTFGDCLVTPRSWRAVVRGRFVGFVRQKARRTFEWGRDTPRDAEPWIVERMRRDQGRVRTVVRGVERVVFGPLGSADDATDAQERMDAIERGHG